MKKLLLISMLIGAMPLAMMAQDDDLYFVPKKNTKVEKVTETAQYEGSSRAVDEYNRRLAKSSYEVIDGDSTKLDIIEFSEGKGVYPDSLQKEDFELTKKMQRFDDYDVSTNAAFWAGYNAGRYDWAWHSPFYYGRYGWGWYDPWYDPWYYGGWYGYYPWYSSWYYPYGYYAWGYPYYWGYPWYYGYYGYYPYYYGGGGGGHYYGHTGNAGTIDRRGGTHSPRYGGAGPVAGNSQRNSSLRDRAARMSGGQVYNSGNSERSRSGNFGGYRGNSSSSSRSNGNYNNSSSRSSNSSYSGGSRSSGGGGFSGGGGSHSSGGGGRSGGGSLGGRR